MKGLRKIFLLIFIHYLNQKHIIVVTERYCLTYTHAFHLSFVVQQQHTFKTLCPLVPFRHLDIKQAYHLLQYVVLHIENGCLLRSDLNSKYSGFFKEKCSGGILFGKILEDGGEGWNEKGSMPEWD